MLMRYLHIYTNFCQYWPGYTEISKGTMEKKAVSLREAAKMLGISIDTARRAIKANRLKAFRLHDRGHYRVSMREIDQFMKDNDHARSSAF